MSTTLATPKKSNGAGRKIRSFGKTISKETRKEEILNAVKKCEGKPSHSKIGKIIGLGARQTGRWIEELVCDGKLEKDTTGRLIVTIQQEKADFDLRLLKDDFNNIPEIAKFIKLKQDDITNSTLKNYLGTLKKIFILMKTHPRVPLSSYDSAQEFFKNFKSEYLKEHPEKTNVAGNYRCAYRRLLDDVGHISYGHGSAKKFGFGSEHDTFKKYAGTIIPKLTCDKISARMLEDKEYLAYYWFNVGIMTGPRSSGMETMVWERINLHKDNFRLEQHEPKVKKNNDIHLGVNGGWVEKLPPLKLLEILLYYKENHVPKNSRFVWFADKGSDKSNRKEARRIRDDTIPKLREYISEFADDLTPLTREFLQNHAGHLLRHTFAQTLKNAGLSDEKIAQMGGWDPQTVSWYCSVPESEKQQGQDVLSGIWG